MIKKELPLQGAFTFDLRVFSDSRGFFTERYKEQQMKEALPESRFIQDNHSRSRPKVIRGLHFQRNPAQGKLVSVVRGRIWDVIVDLRAGSPTFGQHASVELSDHNHRMLWVPPGFAHGFCVLGHDDADVIYKVDQPYSPGNEGAIAWNDPTLKIEWPVETPILSEKDASAASFAEYRKDPWF